MNKDPKIRGRSCRNKGANGEREIVDRGYIPVFPGQISGFDHAHDFSPVSIPDDHFSYFCHRP